MKRSVGIKSYSAGTLNRWLALALPIALCGSCAAVPPPADNAATVVDYSSYRKLEGPALVDDPVLPNLGFTEGAGGWNAFPSDVAIDATSGRAGNPCLRYQRSSGSPYAFTACSFSADRLVPGVRYEFGGWIKTQDIAGGQGAEIGVEFIGPGKYLGGVYSKNGGKGIKGSVDWTWAGGTFVLPQNVTSFSVTPYLTRECSGTAWFDGLYVKRAEHAVGWSLHQVMGPNPTSGIQGSVRLSSTINGSHLAPKDRPATPDLRCLIQVIDAAGKVVADPMVPANGMHLTFDVPPLAAGDYALHASLLDPAHKLILSSAILPLKVDAATPASVPPAHAVVVDELGRTLIDGKPFMPIGIYTQYLTMEDIQRISAGGFNAVHCYPLLNNNLAGKYAFPLDKLYDNGSLETVRATLDACDAAGLKVSVNLKDIYNPSPMECDNKRFGVSGLYPVLRKTVAALKDHPAVLCWYLFDEPTPGSEILYAKGDQRRLETTKQVADFVRDLHREVVAIDPWHPSWVPFCWGHNEDYFDYLGGFEIFGLDLYPFRKTNGAIKHHTELDVAMGGVEAFTGPATTSAFWAVPQIMDGESYRTAIRQEIVERGYAPSEAEMRSLTLDFAIRGAKGFFLYSYFDMRRTTTIGDFDRRWPEVCRLAGTLRELEPFIMSDAAAPALKVMTTDGSVQARAFADGKGAVRVLIAGGSTPGPQQATISATYPGTLKSRYGLTVRNADGSYTFSGTNACSDILESK